MISCKEFHYSVGFLYNHEWKRKTCQSLLSQKAFKTNNESIQNNGTKEDPSKVPLLLFADISIVSQVVHLLCGCSLNASTWKGVRGWKQNALWVNSSTHALAPNPIPSAHMYCRGAFCCANYIEHHIFQQTYKSREKTLTYTHTHTEFHPLLLPGSSQCGVFHQRCGNRQWAGANTNTAVCLVGEKNETKQNKQRKKKRKFWTSEACYGEGSISPPLSTPLSPLSLIRHN